MNVARTCRQELEVLHQFNTKDRALWSKQQKQHTDKKEVVSAIADCKAKLAVKQSEAEVTVCLCIDEALFTRGLSVRRRLVM